MSVKMDIVKVAEGVERRTIFGSAAEYVIGSFAAEYIIVPLYELTRHTTPSGEARSP